MNPNLNTSQFGPAMQGVYENTPEQRPQPDLMTAPLPRDSGGEWANASGDNM